MTKIERTDQFYHSSKTRVYCNNLQQESNKLSFCIKKSSVSDIRQFKLCVRKRKESALFFINYSYSEQADFYYFEILLGQFLDIYKEEARFDLVALTDGENVLRIFYSPLNKQENRYLDIFKLNEKFSISCYRAKNSGVSLIFSTKQKILNESFKGNSLLKSIQFNRKGICQIKVVIENAKEVNIEGLVLVRRKSIDHEKLMFFPVRIIEKNNNIEAIFVFEAKKIHWEQFYWDAFVKVTDRDSNEIFLRIHNNRLGNKIKLQYTHTRYTCDLEDNYIVYPYITASEALSFNYRQKGPYETDKYKWNERIAIVLYLLFGWIFRLQNIWLVHEKFSETAQDNGYYFFKYAYENKPLQKVYFVIRKDSPDYRFVERMKDRVVYFMSIKHLFLLLSCSKIVSSESKGHGYAWRVTKGLIRPVINQKPFMFLQHGVLGLKMIDNTFKANGMNHANLFVVSSEFEKDIVMRYLGYSSKEIIISGLARWDNLHRVKKNNRKENNILFMPTWRNWLEEVPDDDFLNSKYFQTYSSIIKSSNLNKWLIEHNAILNFYIHPKFSQFISHFKTDSERVNIIYFGEQPINKLLMEANLLITDYSSVAFEAYYQDKPTLFFQFDREQYLNFQGSYIDLERDLFGPSAANEEELLEKLDKIYVNGLQIDQQFINLKEHYFLYCDNHNSKRIFDEIVQWEKNRPRYQNFIYHIKRNPIVRTMWRKVKVKFRWA
ncbi:CDP-glycerol glycerophosphotransferase family protein [Neobacillus mesonae]|uniref:CDP-glycerol glycerophosphotransferase family protein n=1 Tax=Neobacillus mesonae TaxID=1193713 RepID=UPI002E1F5996|nr:CDP-glycerol glycerophosphotransferase family protein [Neobacillus mesonae]MED4206268.1 CDP-glycerol glycerophosphotransferase family protein [Neobacillus mesonae]